MQRTRDEARYRFVEGTLDGFGEGVVVAEGDHDVRAYKKVSVEAITVNQLLKGAVPRAPRIFFLTMDLNDGKEKERKARSYILEKFPQSKINTSAGEGLQKALGVTSIEEIVGPIKEVKRRASGEKTGTVW